jgi:hypothetical protein
LAKHGLDFADLSIFFFENAFITEARNGRYKALGFFKDEIIITVVFAPLGLEALSII